LVTFWRGRGSAKAVFAAISECMRPPGLCGVNRAFWGVWRSYPSPLWGRDERSSLLGWLAEGQSGGGLRAKSFKRSNSGFPLLIGHLSFKQASWVHASGEAGRALASEIGLGDRRGRFAPYYAQSPQKTSCDLWAGGE
jgi:hypothetical protein